jgi:outer membrane protein OmpA-like peptidoglycan-associated protein
MNISKKLLPGGCMPALRGQSIIKQVALAALFITGVQPVLKAQETISTGPSWFFGVAGGVNFNFYNGTTQKLNSDVTTGTAFHKGNGRGLYLAPLVEFHRPGSLWGVMLQAGYDNRKGEFDQVMAPCNCPANLSTDLSYITIEPSLRFAPFRSGFYLYGGPRIAILRAKSFTYEVGRNPDFPEQPSTPDRTGDFSNHNKTIFSMQVGAGYDIPLSAAGSNSQFVLSPFVAFHPYYGQDPRTKGSWNVTTVRTGLALKFGSSGKRAPMPPVSAAPVANADVKFSVNAPDNIPAQRRVRETFPLRNYVFFEKGSSSIPDRYVLLSKGQVENFKEERLEEFKPKQLSGRAKRQMIVYYNVINIIGARMSENPGTRIKLVGSSESGPAEARQMAESVKNYLVTIFSIDGSRIDTEGRDKPKLPSEQPGGTKELALLREGDRRVSVESSSPTLLMEFQSGADTQLKPVEILALQDAPADSYVTFTNEGAEKALNSWSLEIKDEQGVIQKFGPYKQEKVAIPGKSILGTRPEGNYKVTMIGSGKDGNTTRKEVPVHMVLWTPAENEEGMRFSVLYEFNDSKANSIYDKYLSDVVAPKIPQGGTVIIHGHTDIIGEDNYNQSLSEARANDVRNIIEKALAAKGRTDVKFQVLGLGEDQGTAPFDNRYPEERFYNRTVIVDIIPQK